MTQRLAILSRNVEEAKAGALLKGLQDRCSAEITQASRVEAA